MSTSIINKFTNEVVSFGQDAHFAVKQMGVGVLWLAEGATRCMYNMNDVKYGGFDKCLKFTIANLNTLTWVYQLGDLFKPAIKALNDQKDLYYAIKIIPTACEIVDPTNKMTRSDKLLGIANFFETCKFFQKNQVFQFATFSKIGTQIGNIGIFGGIKLNETSAYSFATQFQDIPLIGNIVSRPKEIFIFANCCFDLKDIYQKWKGSLEDYLKITGNIGKMALISLSSTSIGKKSWFVLVDLITQDVGLLKYMIDCRKKDADQFAAR